MKEKERYFAPEIEVIKIRPEGVVCGSPDTSLSLGTPFANNEDETAW